MAVLDIAEQSNPILALEDIKLNGTTVDMLVTGLVVDDGRVFIHGNINNHTSEIYKDFIAELTPSEIEAISGMERMSTTRSRVDVVRPHMDEIVNNIVSQRAGDIVQSSGDSFDDVRAAVSEKIANDARVPEVAAAPEPEGPRPANLEAGNVIKVQDYQTDGPLLIEGFDLDGSTGDLVIHDIEFSDGKPFLTGSFSVETSTGSHTREFAVAIDSSRFPDVTQLSVDDVHRLTSADTLKEMLGTRQHDIALSTGVDFPDRARLLHDINGIQAINNGFYDGDIPYLARLGQDYPDLVDTMKLYQNSWSPYGRNDELIKLTIIDHLGIEDAALRSRLVDYTSSLKEFAQQLDSRTDLFARGPETRAAISQMAKHADDIAEMARPRGFGGKSAALRLFGGVTLLGTAASAASAGTIAYEANMMTTLTQEQFAAGEITKGQHDALMAFHSRTTQAQVVDMSAGMADQLVIPSLMITVGVELAARDELTRIATLCDLPEEIYQMHARSMFGGHTASHSAILAATSELADSSEGQPEVLHYAIALKNGIRTAENQLYTFQAPYVNMTVPDDVQAEIDIRQQQLDRLKDSLVDEMGRIMRDPDGIEAFLNTMSVDDRIDFVKSLAMVDENLAAENPLVADMTRDYMNLPLDEQIDIVNGIFAATEALSENNGAALNAYIVSRIMPEDNGSPDAGLSSCPASEISDQPLVIDLSDDGDFTRPDAAAAGDLNLLGSAAAGGLLINPSLITVENTPATAPSYTASVAPS